MLIIRLIKKVFWCLVAALASVFAWGTSAVQMVRNTLALMLDIPGKALKVVTIFFGVVYTIACLAMGGKVLNLVANIAFGYLILLIAYKIFEFIYTFCYALLAKALNFFNFERVINLFARMMQKAFYQYMEQLGDYGPSKKDRIILFAVPWLIHKINWILEKLSFVLRMVVYIVFGFVGIYFSYRELFMTCDTSNFGAVDYITYFAVVLIAFVAAILLAHCIARAIRMAIESVRPLDDLFGVYAEFFRNSEKGTSNRRSGSTSGSDASGGNYTYEEQGGHQTQRSMWEDNPYYEELSVAKTADELKKAYRALVKKLHPDVCKDYSVEEATQRMAQLNNAYEELSKHF